MAKRAGRNDLRHLRVGVVAATSPDIARGGPGPLRGRFISEGWGALPRFV